MVIPASITKDLGNMIGGSTRSALERALAWYNVNLANTDDKEGQDLARCFVEFHLDLLRKQDMQGLIEYSATDANELALKIAKERTGKSKVLCTSLSHTSIRKACEGRRGFFAGIGLEPIIVNVNSQTFQADEEELARKVSEHGRDIAAVVSTHGTTQLGHIETLAEHPIVSQLCEDGAFLHIDAAYGGYISQLSSLMYMTPKEYLNSPNPPRMTSYRFISRIKSIPDADTITLDPYKFIGMQGCSLLLVKKEYAPEFDVPFYPQSRYTLLSTFSGMPIALWSYTLTDCGGLTGLIELADDCVYVARRTAVELLKNKIPLIRFPDMGIVPVYAGDREQAEYLHDAMKEHGFQLGKINFTAVEEGEPREICGVRLVLTPKKEPEYQLSAALNAVTTLSHLM
jgi:glutamate/tyrosine decarboxylase-like PLP-dependent enzyme